MPLYNKKEFTPDPWPTNLKPDDKVFYLPTTKEIFTNYDDFFQRQIMLSSMLWTCSATRRTGLTYEEALESERVAMEALETIPDFFGAPVLYLVHALSHRGRLDDLVNDIYSFIKDRYFVGEKCTYTGERRKKTVRIMSVSFKGEDFTVAPSRDIENESVKASDESKKPEPLRIGSADDYAYTVQIIEDDGTEDDNGVREGISHSELSRSKAIASRSKLKLFLKNSCDMISRRQDVKESIVREYGLDMLTWNEVFGGPVAQFPHTPMMHRGRYKGTPTQSRASPCEPEAESSSMKSIENSSSAVNSLDKKNRGYSKGSYGGEKRSNSDNTEATPPVGSKKSKPGSAKSNKSKHQEKKRKEIEKQQFELQVMFQQARSAGMEDLSKWEQQERLLSEKDIDELKSDIRVAKEQKKERAREAKQRQRELFAEWKKPRDDLLCDDLKPLPQFKPLRLPEWVSEKEFGDYLYIYQFFRSFAELLPIQEVRGTSEVTFADVVTAVRSQDPASACFVELMHILLMAKAERADEEDGDEVDLNNKEELPMDANNDLENKIHGKRIRWATEFHEKIRLTHGMSARHLPIDWMTMTEVLRLSLLSSGYYTGLVTHRFRLFSRGAIRCFEDEGYLFAMRHPETMQKLAQASIFDLLPEERLAMLDALIQQLMSYHKFRSLSEERIVAIAELRRDLKALRAWDAAQEKKAKEARLILEFEAEQVEENGEAARSELIKRPSPSKETLLLLSYLKVSKEAVASRREEEIIKILLDGVGYDEIDTTEEIDDIRSLQKEHYLAKECELLSKVYDLQCRMGYNQLGRDRAFRTYWIIDSLSLLLVEDSIAKDENAPDCENATPLDKVDDEICNATSSDEELRYMLLSCTASDNCPIHCKNSGARWSFVDSLETLEGLIASCNVRGFREMELAENLKFLKNRLRELVSRSAKKTSSGELDKILMAASDDPAAVVSTFDWRREFVEMLLDFEEKMEQGGIGHLHLNGSSSSREEWRELLDKKFSTISSVNGDISVFDEVMFRHEELSDLNPVQHLAVAFLQIIQGVQFKFLRMPFATADSKEKDAVNIPTTTFAQWQKALLQCSSISSLALFYATLEPAILWNKSLLQAKCRICRKRGVVEKLILCARCDRCYHIDCLRPRLSKIRENWKCSDCVAIERAKAAEERRKGKSKEDKYDSYSEEDGDEQSESSSLFDDDVTSTEDQSSDFLELRRTKKGRVVKKVVYTEESHMNGLRKSNKRSSRNKMLNGDSEETDSDIGVPQRHKRARGVIGGNSRTSMGLRESDHQSRDALRSMEQLIRDAMKQESAWPFIDPVDAREVPDYHQIIKRPMDLRTMMNKIKQQLYNRPEEVVADTRLMFENCRIYNEEGSAICGCADKLEHFMQNRFDQLLHNGVCNNNSRSSRR